MKEVVKNQRVHGSGGGPDPESVTSTVPETTVDPRQGNGTHPPK